jgi:anti-sigma factor RsiW
MAITCQDVSARMMELLYGELPGDDRAALEAHLAGCASCAAELATFQSTRAAARRALDTDEPPARAHRAILRAAAAAVAAKQPKPIEARVAAPQPSFWERWRLRWTLPTFATLGAVAVVVLASKVFLEPDKTVELGRRALQSAPAEAPAAPSVVAEPQETGKQAAARQDEQAKEAQPAPVEKKRKDEVPEQPQPSVANNAPARSLAAPTTTPRRRAAPEGFGALGGLTKGGGAASAGRAKAPASDGVSFDDELAAPSLTRPKPAKREFAPPPPPLAEPARPSTPTANQVRERDTESEALEESEAPARGSVGHAAGAGAAPPPAHAKAKKVEMPLDMDSLERGRAAASAPAPAAAPVRPQGPPAAPAAAVADKADAKSEIRAESKPVADSPVARADRLFAQGQWAAAARAYRDLLHRDPNNGDAARWRQRLAASEEAASAQAPAAASPASRRR